MRLTLINDYHNTSVNLRVALDAPAKIGDEICLTAGQVKKAAQALCGVAGCQCSGSLGVRGRLSDLGGNMVRLEIYPISPDGRHITGATLVVVQVDA